MIYYDFWEVIKVVMQSLLWTMTCCLHTWTVWGSLLFSVPGQLIWTFAFTPKVWTISNSKSSHHPSLRMGTCCWLFTPTERLEFCRGNTSFRHPMWCWCLLWNQNQASKHHGWSCYSIMNHLSLMRSWNTNTHWLCSGSVSQQFLLQRNTSASLFSPKHGSYMCVGWRKSVWTSVTCRDVVVLPVLPGTKQKEGTSKLDAAVPVSLVNEATWLRKGFFNKNAAGGCTHTQIWLCWLLFMFFLNALRLCANQIIVYFICCPFMIKNTFLCFKSVHFVFENREVSFTTSSNQTRQWFNSMTKTWHVTHYFTRKYG